MSDEIMRLEKLRDALLSSFAPSVMTDDELVGISERQALTCRSRTSTSMSTLDTLWD